MSGSAGVGMRVGAGLALAALVTMGTTPALLAQGGMVAYPNGGQSSQQQAQDSIECQQWATGQTGFQPGQQVIVQGGDYYYPPPPQSSGLFGQGEYGYGGGLSDAGRGAAIGAIGGAIGGDAGKGAAIGALSGLFIGGIRRSQRDHEYEQWQRQQAQQRAAQERAAMDQYRQQQSVWDRAYGACMTARNYVVG